MKSSSKRAAILLFSSIVGVTFFTGTNANAVTLTADYSGLGTVYQDAAGQLYTSAAAGRTDVTSLVESDISTDFTYLQAAITLQWNETIHFQLTDLTGEGAVADSGINNEDANGRPSDSTIRISTGFNDFVDPTPFDNSEFTMSTGVTSLGGGQVNNKVFGDSTSLMASSTYDFLTLMIHETEHSLGISSGLTRFVSLVGAPDATPGAPNRSLTISAGLSGLPSDYVIPIEANSAHFPGSPVGNDPFGYAVVADPGWQYGQRALPTALDIEAIGQIEGATSSQINLNYLNSVPEPSSLALLAIGAVGFLGLRRRSV
jgi:hypothetical protein